MTTQSYGSNQEAIEEFQTLYHRLFRLIRAEWNKHGEKEVSPSQALILEILACNGTLKVAELANYLHITSGAVTGFCDKLIAAGFVERRRDEGDRRVVYLDITPVGLSMLERVKQYRLEIMQRIFQGVSSEDMGHLIRIFKQVFDNIDRSKQE